MTIFKAQPTLLVVFWTPAILIICIISYKSNGKNQTYSSNMATITTNVVNVQTNTTSVFRYDGALFQRVKDALDAILSHCDQETTRQLGTIGACVEQSGCCVNEPLL